MAHVEISGTGGVENGVPFGPLKNNAPLCAVEITPLGVNMLPRIRPPCANTAGSSENVLAALSAEPGPASVC